jgi:hypothetical protein
MTMALVIYHDDGTIVAVHHNHSEDSLDSRQNTLTADWDRSWDIGSKVVENGDIVDA